MDVTLAGLSQALGDELRPVAPVPVPATAVTGVHVSELLDPTPFLEGGELLLTTGLKLPDQALPLDAYAARLAGDGVAGLALGLGPMHAGMPPLLVRACERARLPLFEVPVRTRFQSVVREFWRQVGTGREEDLRAAMGSSHALVRAATAEDAPAAVTRALAAAVGGWVAVLDPAAQVRTVHPRAAVGTATRAAAEIGRMRLSGPRAAVTFGLGRDDVLAHGLDRAGGHLVTGCPRPLPPHARHLVMSACALLQLRAEWSSPTTAFPLAAPVAVGTLARLGHATAAADLAAHLRRPVPRVVRLALVSGVEAEAVAVDTGSLFAPGDPTLLVLDAEHADATWGRLTASADASTTPGARGVLTAPATWPEIPHLLTRGREAYSRTPDGVLRDLAAPTPAASVAAGVVDEQRLAALAAHPRAELVATLATYLRHRGRVGPAADALGLHRNSVRHRLTLIRQMLGVDIDDPDVAAQWWLELRSRGLA
ncbi:PucR family transcriptional regulator [Mobilicoccus massiliensis]|uniref:PucR family transcriptional regulator n=1 Tax=Mobilicoccus massiliensis TaxID=1522310 RepID=UPI00058FA5F7|nr:PucR family transcriptional regulator [Mobilicoccus massiliensis]